MGDWGGDWQGPSAATSSGLVIAQSAVAIPHTGDTNETVLATIAVPANAIGKNGRIEIRPLFSYTNSANNKTLRMRFGLSGSGLTGTVMANGIVTTTTAIASSLAISNRNSSSSQISQGALTASFSATVVTPVTTAFDTTQATEINITGQLALGSETITLEAYQVILYPKS